MTDTPTPAKGFDPAKHLSKVKGNDYLEAKWRIVWFRDQYPAGSIDTDLVSHTGNTAIFKAKVVALDTDGVIHGSATGWGSCDVSGFDAYIEKAETKAISRALATLGFGTQFSLDLDDTDAIADSPVNRGTTQERPPANFTAGAATTNNMASPKQQGMINALGRELKISSPQMEEMTQRVAGTSFDGLTRKGASSVIEELQDLQKRPAVEQSRPRSTAEEVDAALASSTPTSLPFNVPDDRYTRS